MRHVAAFQIPCLATHLHSLNEVEYRVVDAFSRNEGKRLSVSQGETVHWVDVICRKAGHELVLTLAGAFVNLLETKSLVMLYLATSHGIWTHFCLFRLFALLSILSHFF